jgi:Tfp pilus assembly protein PilX
MKHMTRGFALPTLMIMLALASIATLLAMRNLWVNDQLLNAEADRLRALHKAEAAMPVAIADILGSGTHSDGTTNLRHAPGNTTQTHAFFPTSMADYDLLRQRINTEISSCSAGICAPHTLDPKAVKAGYWKARIASAMSISASDTPYGDNTALYWIEVFPRDGTSAASATSPPPFVYRITVLAHGVMPGSATMLQAVWTRHSNASLTGQWHSWYVLHD